MHCMGWQSKVNWANVDIVPYFSAIGQTVAELSSRFNGIKHEGHPPFWIFKNSKF